MSETDVIRAVRLRKKLNIRGQSVDNVLLFRDKVPVKQSYNKKFRV